MTGEFLDLDVATEEAFAWFAEMLEASLDALDCDHQISVRQLAGHRTQKVMQVTKTSSGLMVWALDNGSLPAERRLTRSAMARLRALGFQHWKQLPGFYVAVFPATQAYRAAQHLVEALREAYGVLHPSLLAEPVFPDSPVATHEAPPMPLGPDDPVDVADEQHLDDLIAHLFASRGLAVEWDADRVAHAMVEGCELTLRGQQGIEAVRLTAAVPMQVHSPSKLLGILGRDGLEVSMFDVVLTGTQVTLEATIHAQPFHTDFVLELMDEMLAERNHAAHQLERLLADDPLIRPDGVDE